MNRFPIAFRTQNGIELYVCDECVESAWSNLIEDLTIEAMEAKEEAE